MYCAGLFDYLQERVCKQLMNMFYDMLAPGGVLIATNVDAANPIQRIMGYIFEWHLIYRTGKQLAAVAPDEASPDDYRITADITGCNIFIEVREASNPPVNDTEIKQEFARYDRQVTIQNTKTGCLLSSTLMPAGSFAMDYFVYPEHLWPFFQLRLISALLTGIIFLLLMTERGQKHYRVFRWPGPGFR